MPQNTAPNHAFISMHGVRNSSSDIVLGGVAGDTITAVGDNGTAAGLPSWLQVDASVDANYGFGLKFTEKGTYSGVLQITADLNGAEVSAARVLLVSKASPYYAQFGALTTKSKVVSQGITLDVFTPATMTSALNGTNVVPINEFHGFYVQGWPLVSGSPTALVDVKLDLSLSKVA